MILKGQSKQIFDFLKDGYCKTRHVSRMWNFNQEMARNSRVTAGLPKLYSGFPKLCPGGPKISCHSWDDIPHSANKASLPNMP